MNNQLYVHRENLVLTRNERDAVESVPPVISDLDGFLCFCINSRVVALSLRMLNQLLEIFSLESVENIEEIFSIRYSTLGHFGRKIFHDLFVTPHHWPQFDDS